MPADLVVEARGLRKTYGLGTAAELEVLKGVDLQVRAGEFLAVIGQSGSGKTTLLNLLGALDTPTGGYLAVDGVEVARLDSEGLAYLRSRSIGFVFQFHFLLDEFTCLENALMPLLIRPGGPSKQDLERVTRLMERVGLEEQLHNYPTEVSGGQQQRTAVVRALSNEPTLVLADEPTGNLDSRNGQQVFRLMREVIASHRAAFVMVTHDDRLARAADRVLRIEDGLMAEVDKVLL